MQVISISMHLDVAGDKLLLKHCYNKYLFYICFLSWRCNFKGQQCIFFHKDPMVAVTSVLDILQSVQLTFLYVKKKVLHIINPLLVCQFGEFVRKMIICFPKVLLHLNCL